MGLLANDTSYLNDDLFTPTSAPAPGLDGKYSNNYEWGGYVGGADDARARYDQAAVDASRRKAVGLDYQGSRDGEDMQEGARRSQADAMARAAMAAQGQGLQSQAVGQSMLQQGLANQQAAAMSARGGSMAQAAAMQQRRGGAGAYMQAGQHQLDAQRAQEMARARQQYMGAASGMREQDLSVQGQMEERARQQQRSELSQRQLNDQGQFAYDQLTDNVNKAQMTAGMRDYAARQSEEQGRNNARRAEDQMQDAKAIGWVQTGASLAAAASDERTKQSVSQEKNITGQLADGLSPYRYEYKPDFVGSQKQQPGEQNVGPMAQNMARNPVTATAVGRGDDGMLYVDTTKATKLALGGIGELAAKQQRLEAELASLRKGK